MYDRFATYSNDNNIFKQGDKILLAVSGGIDSMVMTELFIRVKADIAIAHCNFSLRDKESDGDEEFVTEFCAENNIPIFVKKFDTITFASREGISIQMAARELRHKWFEEIRQSSSFNLIALGHNSDDNIETFLINLSRGTGLKGLTGISPVSGNIIRPILFAPRDEITSFATENRVIFREDSSNRESKYLRNKIRHRILPVLREINPSLNDSFDETVKRLQESYLIMEEWVNKVSSEVTELKNGDYIIDIKKLNDFEPVNTLLFELFRQFDIGTNQIDDLRSLITANSGKYILTRTHRIIKDRNKIIIEKSHETPELCIKIDNRDEILNIEGFNSSLIPIEEYELIKDPGTASIDIDTLSYPLILRYWREGDFFIPLGMKGKKKISDFLIDMKIPVNRKPFIRVLESENNIVCIIGYRLDNRFRVTSATRSVLVLTEKKR